MTSILGLDASMYVGHAFFRAADVKPLCGTWVAKGGLWKSDEYGDYFLAFEEWLEEMISVLQPQVLAFESPIIVARGGWGEDRGSDENNIRRLIGIVSVAELVGRRHKLRCVEVHNSTAKSFMGLPTRRPRDMTAGQFKDLMIAAMTNRDYECADSHQADACAVALVIYSDLEGGD